MPVHATLYREVLSVTDAIELPEGWVLLDGRAVRLHLLAHDGTLVWSVAREGGGPGELRSPAALVPTREGFGVVDMLGTRVDRFSADGGYLGYDRLPASACPGGGRVAGAGAGPPGSRDLLLLRRCTDSLSGAIEAVVESVTPGGSVGVVGRTLLHDISTGEGDMLALPILVTGAGRGYVADGLGPCLLPLMGGGADAPLCHPAPAREPLDEAALLELEAVAARVRLRLPEARAPAFGSLPLFDAAFGTPAGVALRRVIAPEVRVLESLHADGTLRRLDLPPHEASWVGATSILLLWEGIEGSRLLLREADPADR